MKNINMRLYLHIQYEAPVFTYSLHRVGRRSFIKDGCHKQLCISTILIIVTKSYVIPPPPLIKVTHSSIVQKISSCMKK